MTTVKYSKHHETLKDMFPELKDSEPVEEWETPSYNDGGSYVTTIWEGPGRHTRTNFNSWSVKHPDTTIQIVERFQFKEWRFRGKESKRFYGD